MNRNEAREDRLKAIGARLGEVGPLASAVLAVEIEAATRFPGQSRDMGSLEFQRAVALVDSLKPQSPIELAIAAQMAAARTLGMWTAAGALASPEPDGLAARTALDFFRMFDAQLAALQSLQARHGE